MPTKKTKVVKAKVVKEPRGRATMWAVMYPTIGVQPEWTIFDRPYESKREAEESACPDNIIIEIPGEK